MLAIVDDDEIFQFITRKIIDQYSPGKQMETFNNGSEMLNFIVNNRKNNELLPGIILLDLEMPVMDGWVFLQEFAKIKNSLCRQIVIYVLSSSVSDLDIKKANDTDEVSGFIRKPLTHENIKEILNNTRAVA